MYKVHWIIDGIVNVNKKIKKMLKIELNQKFKNFYLKIKNFLMNLVLKPFKEKLIYQERMKKIKLMKLNIFILIILITFNSVIQKAYSSGKIYGKSQTVHKEYKKYETCRLKKVEINLKDGKKDGYKCIYRRQLKGKDVTVMQPLPQCQVSFKCKRENQN